MKNSLTIYYKNIKDAVALYENLKALQLDYLEVGSFIPKPDKEVLVELRVKASKYCPMRSTWDQVKSNDTFKLSGCRFRSAKAYADCVSYYED
jgi:hypothetical protein